MSDNNDLNEQLNIAIREKQRIELEFCRLKETIDREKKELQEEHKKQIDHLKNKLENAVKETPRILFDKDEYLRKNQITKELLTETEHHVKILKERNEQLINEINNLNEKINNMNQKMKTDDLRLKELLKLEEKSKIPDIHEKYLKAAEEINKALTLADNYKLQYEITLERNIEMENVLNSNLDSNTTLGNENDILKKKIFELECQLTQNKNEIKKIPLLENQIKKLNKKLDDCEKHGQELSKLNSKKDDEIKKLQKINKELKERNEHLSNEIKKLNEKIINMNDKMKKDDLRLKELLELVEKSNLHNIKEKYSKATEELNKALNLADEYKFQYERTLERNAEIQNMLNSILDRNTRLENENDILTKKKNF